MSLLASSGARAGLVLAFVGGLGLFSAGCSSCSGGNASKKKATAELEKGSKKGKKGKKKRARTDKNPDQKAVRIHDLKATPTAAVVTSGDKAWMWVDGRSNAMSAKISDVRWSAQGFEFPAGNGLTKVLAPGGSTYLLAREGQQPDSKPLAEVLREKTTPPEGFAIDYIDGGGGTKVQAVLTGPDNRRVRIGLFRQVPESQVWLEGQLPADGKASPPPSARFGFAKDDEGDFLNKLPSGAQAAEWGKVRDADLSEWLSSVQSFAKAGSKLTAGVSVAADLDRDGFEEAIICLDGEINMLEPRCVLVDIVNDQTRIYSAGLPWSAGGNQPVLFTVDGAPYVLMVSTEDAKSAFVLRSYGTGWVTEPVR